MKIRIFRDGSIIRVYHSPQDVVVKPSAQKVELYNIDGILTGSYNLMDKKLSWLEDEDLDSAEIVLDLTIAKQ